MPRLAALAIAGALLGWGACARGDVIVLPEVVNRLATVESTRKAESIFNTAKARVEALPLNEQPLALQDLPALRVRNNALTIDMGNIPPLPAEIRLRVPGVTADFMLRHQCVTPQTSTLSMQRYDWDSFDSDRLWAATLSVRSTYILAQAYGGRRGEVYSVQLTQRVGRVSMTVYPLVAGAQGKLLFSVTVKDLAELRARHPVEVRKYAAPLLELIAQKDLLRPGAADVYRAFADIQPTPAALKRLAQVCQSLESEDPADRGRASQELATLGPQEVLAALRLDVDRLSPELRSRIRLFLAEHTHLDADRAALLSDKPFLVDCLEDPDLAVRRSAHDALAGLLGSPIEYDADAPPAKRAKAVEELRRLIQPPAPPQGTLPPATRQTGVLKAGG